MCYYATDDSGIKVAEEDIPVTKECFVSLEDGEIQLNGRYQIDYIYDLSGNVVVEEDVSLEPEEGPYYDDCDEINEGFHFSTCPDVRDSDIKPIVYCLFWVPKGARYRYNDEYQEIVADSYKFGEIIGASKGVPDEILDIIYKDCERVKTLSTSNIHICELLRAYLESKDIKLLD